ncbi:stabilized1-like protein [Tanacetum coccineum]
MQAPVGNLNNARPPVNYVAGLGRGFTSFTTRSDIGHARVLAVGDQEGYDENQTFDEFEGNDVGLFFASAEYNEEDKEADAIWDEIDKRMDSRRKDRREARVKEEIEKYRVSNTKITEQFVDLKRKLVTLSDADWDGVPEIGDYSSRNKKKRFERITYESHSTDSFDAGLILKSSHAGRNIFLKMSMQLRRKLICGYAAIGVCFTQKMKA